MTQEFLTRPANIIDAPELLGMQKSLAEYCGYDISHFGMTEDHVRGIVGGDGQAKYFVAESQTETAGMILLNRIPMGWQGNGGVYVEDLYIKPEYRHGLGVGKLLMKQACEVALEYAHPNPDNAFVRLDTSIVDNDNTLRFYRGLEMHADNLNFRLYGRAIAELADRPRNRNC